MLAEAPPDGGRRGALGHEDGGRPDAQREAHGVAEAVREEQLGRREHDIVLADAEHGNGIILCGVDHIRLQVHSPLELAGRTGCIEPEADVVGRRGGGLEGGVRSGEQLLEPQRGPPGHGGALHDVAVDNDVIEEWLVFQRRRYPIEQRGRDHDGAGAGVAEEVGIVLGGEQGAHRDGDDARLDRAEKDDRKSGSVEHDEEYSLLHLDAEPAERVARAVHALGERGIRELRFVVDEGDFIAAPLAEVTVDEIRCGVVKSRDVKLRRARGTIGGGERAHGRPPGRGEPTRAPPGARRGRPAARGAMSSGRSVPDDNPELVREGYDRIAEEYARHIAGELAGKPLDRELLDAFAARVHGRGPACEVGCGPGHVARYLADRGVDICGIESVPEMVNVASRLHPDIPFRQGDMLDLPEADGTWAGVLAFYAIVNFGRMKLSIALKEIARVLRPGGVLLLAFHIGDAVVHVDEMWSVQTSLDFVFHLPDQVASCLREAGLEVEQVVEREPYPGVEHPSRRAYIWARRPS